MNTCVYGSARWAGLRNGAPVALGADRQREPVAMVEPVGVGEPVQPVKFVGVVQCIGMAGAAGLTPPQMDRAVQ